MKVFLGGTVNDSTWRDYVIPLLKIDYFNPVVPVWNDAAYEKELYEKRHANYNLYVITPKFTGFFAIAEVADDAFHKPDQTVYCFLKEDQNDTFNSLQLNTLEDLGQTVRANGGIWLRNLDEVIAFLNQKGEQIELSEATDLNDCFISYGKAHSLDLSKKITQYFDKHATSYWLDSHITPLGHDKQGFVDNRIQSASNFIFIISPQSVKSESCVRELEYADENNKSIIVIHHTSPKGNWDDVREILKNYKWHYNDENSQESVLFDLNQSVQEEKLDKKLHAQLLLKVDYWIKNGKNIDDLLYGKDRNKFSDWWSEQVKNGKFRLNESQQSYLDQSLNQQFFTRHLNSLSKRLEFITHYKHFDKIIGLIALISPLSFVPQMTRVTGDLINGEDSHGVSISMFLIFLFINLSLVLVWIKQRNKSMLASKLLSIFCILTIVLVVLLQ